MRIESVEVNVKKELELERISLTLGRNPKAAVQAPIKGERAERNKVEGEKETHRGVRTAARAS